MKLEILRRSLASLLGLALGVSLAAPSSACSILNFPPLTHALQDVLVVTGTVEATGLYNLPGGEVVSPAVRVAISEALVGPPSLDAITVFLFTYGADCERSPASHLLLQHYPIGASVSLVANPIVTESGHTYYGAHSDTFGFLALTDGVAVRLPSGALDFGQLRDSYEPNSFRSWSDVVASRNLQRQWFEDVEYVRALLLLSQASPDQRCEIAKQIASYHRWQTYHARVAQKDLRRLLRRYQVPRRCQGQVLQVFRGALPER